MRSYASFCPVAKTAEIFAERWTPLLLRELCMGARRFGELQQGLPLISRSLLAQRLRELELAGVVERVPLPDGVRHEYRLTAEGDAFRPLIDLMGMWGQTHGRGRIRPGDTDPAQLVWGMRRHLETAALPAGRLVVQFEFSGVTKARNAARYWWLVLRRPEVDVCQKHPGYDVDVTIAARLHAFTLVWLGHRGLAEARRAGEVRLDGPPPKVALAREALGLRDEPWLRSFDFSPRPDPFGPPAPPAG